MGAPRRAYQPPGWRPSVVTWSDMEGNTTPGAGALGCCPHCGSRLAYPLHCKRAGEDTWKLRLRCPDCEKTWSRCAPTLEVRRFDRRLADDRRSLVEHLREIERIEREGEIERFSSALAADAILPEDFAR